MIKYTTPTITLRIKNKDITGADVYVSIEQGATKLTKKNDFTITYDGTNTTIKLVLTQQESALFNYSHGAEMQVNWINAEEVREATTIKRVAVMRNLLDKVINYGD